MRKHTLTSTLGSPDPISQKEFKMSFLITHKNNFIAYSYSKSFMLFKSVCDFSEKKLWHNMSAFFCIVRAACHLKQLLNHDVVSEQYRDSTWSWESLKSDSFEAVTWSWASSELNLILILIAVWKQQQNSVLSVCSYKEKTINDSENKWFFFLIQHVSFHMFCFFFAVSCTFFQNWAVLTLWMIFFLTWFRAQIFSAETYWWWAAQIWCTAFWTSEIHHLQLYFKVSLNHSIMFSIN